ncbi:peptide/nickel transport system permease protein [Jiangella alba]|uniref:Peptide/nickel transport system permease protein n=2 Tax=Jiangella alba TaxID=561176 RepID=A0A1H5CN24_9ACTN|nr:ABC transporter permease [Jiangella alba]SED67858.1 peptide/nickel transport system permease protein [Jiangella alba]
MLTFVVRRVALMIPTLVLISIVTFTIIQLPPGDFLTTYVTNLSAQGEQVDPAEVAALRARYGLDEPLPAQYLTWIWGIVSDGDFGRSFEWNRPVAEMISDRLPLTIVFMAATVVFTWIIAFPIGLYSAIRQYSITDYVATTIGFLGLAIPNFLLALALMWMGLNVFGQDSVGGLFSPEYKDAAWNLGKVLDLMGHLWVPMVVLGTAGTAGLIRILRANLLDELRKPYVTAARARGMPERRLLLRYPMRVALNPFVSTIGWVLPVLIGGEVIVSSVLSLETTGPLLLSSLQSQDMYLAGSIILLVSVMTVIGTLISDLLLAWLDPRIRHRMA